MLLSGRRSTLSGRSSLDDEKVNRYIEFPTIVRKPEIMAAGSLHLLYVKLNIHTMMIEYAESAKRK